MSRHTPVPPRIAAACDLLKRSGVCAILRHVEAVRADCSRLEIGIAVPTPISQSLPPEIRLGAYIPHAFPLADVEFYPIGPELRGFPHQEASTGKLCLRVDADAPWDDSRLLTYVQWAVEWIRDAAAGQLLRQGDPYELPDFRGDQPLRVPPLMIDDSVESFGTWQGLIPHAGTVELNVCRMVPAMVPVTFWDDHGCVLRTTGFSEAFRSGSRELTAAWITLPSIVVERHRPPATWAELASVCQHSNISLDRALQRAWASSGRDFDYGILLVGFPIPRRVGEEPVEIHWQPLVFPNKFATQRSVTGRWKKDQTALWRHGTQHGPFRKTARSPWGTTINVSPERQFARGGFSEKVAQLRVVIAGCGAIGSVVAEQFIRSGSRSLVLIDPDVAEFGNFCRHTLDGASVGKNKATELARRLSSVSPLARVLGIDAAIPPTVEMNRAAVEEALLDADLIIDCSTDHTAFLWLSQFARANGKRLASAFINIHATLLTLILSGRNITGRKILEGLTADVVAGKVDVPADEFLGHPQDKELLMPGAGCWHPTFPALNRHIALLTSSALDHLIQWLEQQATCSGTAVVLRRPASTAASSSSIEILVSSRYR